MFAITTRKDAPKPFHDRLLDAAESLANKLRNRPTMPAHPQDATRSWMDVTSGGRLPPVSCAFRGCSWYGGNKVKVIYARTDPEHPWDQELKQHVLSKHNQDITEASRNLAAPLNMPDFNWDLYNQAIAVKERRSVPIVGPSIDRRVMEHIVQVYNDTCVRSLICFCCAQIKPDTGGCRSKISIFTGSWLLALPPQILQKNFAHDEFQKRYCQSGTPLARRGKAENAPDFADWVLRWRKTDAVSYTHLTLPTKA